MQVIEGLGFELTVLVPYPQRFPNPKKVQCGMHQTCAWMVGSVSVRGVQSKCVVDRTLIALAGGMVLS